MKYWSIVCCAGISVLGCGSAPGASNATTEVDDFLAGSGAAGRVPAGLPARLLVGLDEDSGQSWMRSSGVKWDVRYRYFVKGWVNNWGYGAYDGSWGLAYLRECDQEGFVPAVEYYQLVGEPGGSESQELTKLGNAATMQSYFGDFKILMQRAKDFGKPMLVLLEADAFGFLEQQSGGNPNAYAAVAASGVPELAGLPNTVAGWGLAFLKLRAAVGASDVTLGVHVSAWASGKDLAYGDVTSPLSPEVDKVYAFLSPLGLSSNATGQQFDVLVGDPLDRDSDYYKVVEGQDRWWDPSDGASISSKSFNRYAEWLRLWNQKAQKRWVLWQIPLGNSNHQDVYNNGAPRQGYRDNRAEYFFANGTAHLSKFADDGVLALLFGAGAGGQSSYQNDTYTDGKLFMQSRAGSFLNAGGLSIADGSGGGVTTGSGGAPGSGGATGTGGSTTQQDSSRYGFESSAQGWAASGGPLTGALVSSDRSFAGNESLKVTVNGAAGSGLVSVAAPATPAGATVTFHVWIPAGSPISSVQPFVMQGASGGWTWTGTWRAANTLRASAWNTITVTVPPGASVPLWSLGVQFTTSASWTGAVYVDAVTW